jgi:hypothetical protein
MKETFEGQDFAISLKRIEYLLEELIFQNILTREQDCDTANEKFKTSMGNVSDSLLGFFQLPEQK